MGNEIFLEGDHGKLRLQAAGGMIGPAEFNLSEVGPIRPPTCPGWSNRDDTKDMLPHIRDLNGDFVCAPFGAPEASEALPEQWRKGAGSGLPEDPWFHGYSANSPWEITANVDDTSRAILTNLPPDHHPFSRLERHVSLLTDAPSYRVELRITARHDVRFPLSLHPCFHMPKETGAVRVKIPDAGRGWTYPLPLIPNNAPLAVDARFDNLNAVSCIDGTSIDPSRLPPLERFEGLVQIPAPKGEMQLVYEQAGYTVKFNYDADLLPSLVIWISDQGRDETPFDGKFRTLGIEAVAGAFDLGSAVSNSSENPIAREGISTAISLMAGQELITASSVTLQALLSAQTNSEGPINGELPHQRHRSAH